MDVRGVADGREARDALAQRGDESGMFDKLRREIEKLDLVSGFGVDAIGPAAETIDGHGRPGRLRLGALGSSVQRAFQTDPERPRLW